MKDLKKAILIPLCGLVNRYISIMLCQLKIFLALILSTYDTASRKGSTNEGPEKGNVISFGGEQKWWHCLARSGRVCKLVNKPFPQAGGGMILIYVISCQLQIFLVLMLSICIIVCQLEMFLVLILSTCEQKRWRSCSLTPPTASPGPARESARVCVRGRESECVCERER